MATGAEEGLSPEMAVALVGVLGGGAQWLAWRLRLPGIVLLLAAGLIVGPLAGIFVPARDLGPIVQPLVALAVAVILFEGGLTLSFHGLRGAAEGVRRLVFLGAPLGWIASAAALHWVAGLGWGASAVFGGIMIVTGPTVIAPLLRQARLRKRPAALLQWEAIVNDPVGALAAVLAFAVLTVVAAEATPAAVLVRVAGGILFGAALGFAAGWALVRAFRGGRVPEYMKVPALFVTVIAVFAVSDEVLHESGLLAVTVMGVVVANSQLPSFGELRRFKEQATVLLVSGVFILLAAGISREDLAALDWRMAAFVASVVLVARPAAVLLALAGSAVPWRERLLVALTGPRGVVLVAVAGVFGEALLGLGIEDGARIVPLAFALVAATVVLHGFTLTPLARALGLTAAEEPGVILVGGTPFTVAFAEALKRLEVPVLVADRNYGHLREARAAGIEVFYGDILSEAAEQRLELVAFERLVAASDDDAYNTLVATDLAPEFGRENVFQLARAKTESRRFALPPTLGGRALPGRLTCMEAETRVEGGWRFTATTLSEDYTLDDWRADNPEALVLGEKPGAGALRLLTEDARPVGGPGTKLLVFAPPEQEGAAAEGGGR